ncbi:DUF5362 domain-containing protein [Mucilaginibacter sp. RS28]|uniref:DUF5362 domain-containing protein n=1 Tax=Mucilaginibacter straminoryzae TaxID=2932774 RepID=A0A9X1X353_9SPHI|nr:DUF5362 family protein [Mucilaginibacter straminoryzae]MCJ8209996.1 DUF5362 domain-containing protein [Mucilaginibacter straminoryzae]
MDETLQPEVPELQPTPEPELLLTPEAQYYLNEGAGWARFLGIMGFIGSAFILIMAIFAGSVFSILGRMSPTPMPAGVGAFIGIGYGCFALLYFFPSMYLYQFANQAKQGILFKHTPNITTAVAKLKSFFKFWGVLTVIMIALMVLSFVFSIMIGLRSH